MRRIAAVRAARRDGAARALRRVNIARLERAENDIHRGIRAMFSGILS
jgi:hypothetical protein